MRKIKLFIICIFLSKMVHSQNMLNDTIFAIPSKNYDTLYLLETKQMSKILYRLWQADTMAAYKGKKPVFIWTNQLPNIVIKRRDPIGF
jgi:hypothetical protein